MPKVPVQLSPNAADPATYRNLIEGFRRPWSTLRNHAQQRVATSLRRTRHRGSASRACGPTGLFRTPEFTNGDPESHGVIPRPTHRRWRYPPPVFGDEAPIGRRAEDVEAPSNWQRKRCVGSLARWLVGSLASARSGLADGEALMPFQHNECKPAWPLPPTSATTVGPHAARPRTRRKRNNAASRQHTSPPPRERSHNRAVQIAARISAARSRYR